MSKFLQFPQFIIELGRSIQDWKDELKTHLANNGWQLVNEGNDPFWFEVIPPANQTIGNAYGKEITRFDFTGTETRVKTYAAGTTAVQSQHVLGFPFYTYENYIDINGVRISTGNTNDYYMNSGPRATLFYNALQQYRNDNPDSDLAKLRFTLITDPNNAGRGDIIVEPGDGITPTFLNSYNIPLSQTRGNYTPGTAAAYSETLTLTHDLASGFVYYLSIHERKIELATKTTAAFFGPVGVQYVDNATALAATPAGLVPIEAVTYSSQGVDFNYPNIGTRFSHVWGIATGAAYGQFNGRHAELFSGTAFFEDRRLVDRRVADNQGRGDASPLGLSPDTIPYAIPAGVNIASVAVRPRVTYDQSTNNGLTFLQPGLPLPDVFIALNASTNESLHLGRVVTDATPFVQITGAGAEVQDGSKFPAAGAFIVGSEIIKYTGKAGNVLTGLTRGAYATVQVEHAAGALAYPAMWFVKINGGMMTAGYTKPGESEAVQVS